MLRQQKIVIVVAVIALLGLYQLPKVVVENDEATSLSNAPIQESETEVHQISIPDSIRNSMDGWRNVLLTSNSPEKSFIFADSLARAFLVYNQIDSVIRYASELEALASSTEATEKVGDLYYSAFGLSNDQSQTQLFAQKVQEQYQKVIDITDRPDLEMRMAMTMVSGPNPMDGILKLRELAAQHPENIEGQYNLGILSIRSGQYNKAIERFERVIALDSTNLEAYFYAGVSYMEKGDTDRAKEYLDIVTKRGNNPALNRLVEEYLNEIN